MEEEQSQAKREKKGLIKIPSYQEVFGGGGDSSSSAASRPYNPPPPPPSFSQAFSFIKTSEFYTPPPPSPAQGPRPNTVSASVLPSTLPSSSSSPATAGASGGASPSPAQNRNAILVGHRQGSLGSESPEDEQDYPDMSDMFNTEQLYSSKEEIQSWVYATGKICGMVVIVYKSDINTQKRRPYIIFACERSGSYRTNIKIATGMEDSKEDTANVVTKKSRQRSTKKCDCPFRLKGYSPMDGEWVLSVTNGKHNHFFAEQLPGHSYAGKLHQREKELVKQLYSSGVKPRAMLRMLKENDPINVSMMKNVFNEISKIKEDNRKLAKQEELAKQQAEEEVKQQLEEKFFKKIKGKKSKRKNVSTKSSLRKKDLRQSAFPPKVIPYIAKVIDVLADGNCGFRSVACLIGLSEENWPTIRKAMLIEMKDNIEIYREMFGFYGRVVELMNALSWETGPCAANNWMIMPDMGHVIANCFNLVFVLLSNE